MYKTYGNGYIGAQPPTLTQKKLKSSLVKTKNIRKPSVYQEIKELQFL